MDDLARWLGAQLDEDERIAQGADPGPWKNNSLGRHDQSVIKLGPPTSASLIQFDGSRAAANGAHVARHDPARVLREIDAKRQLLDDFTVTARIRDEAAMRIKAAGDHPDPKDLETWDRAQREAAILEGPVKLAASPLADRPGYREEWRP